VPGERRGSGCSLAIFGSLMSKMTSSLPLCQTLFSMLKRSELLADWQALVPQ
jgi:hypothetical protein